MKTLIFRLMKAGSQAGKLVKHDFRLYKNMPTHIVDTGKINMLVTDEELYAILTAQVSREEKINRVNKYLSEISALQRQIFNMMKKEGLLPKNLHYSNTKTDFVAGVIALSLDLQYEVQQNNKILNLIREAIVNFVEDFSNLMGTEIVYIIEHDDEKSVNFHFLMTNLRAKTQPNLSDKFGLNTEAKEKVQRGLGRTITGTFIKNSLRSYTRSYQFTYSELQDMFYNYILLNYPQLQIERGIRRETRIQNGEEWYTYTHIPLHILKHSPYISQTLRKYYDKRSEAHNPDR